MGHYNGSTTYSYDDWGRLSTETRGSVTKTYNWTAANLLESTTTNEPGSTGIAYLYTPHDLKRIWRTEGGQIKQIYYHDAGFNVLTQAEWSGGAQVGEKTYVGGGLAEVDTNSTPAYTYMTQDHLGSTRGSWNGSKVQTANWEYGPYGTPLTFAGPSSVTQLYTGHDLDKITGNYFAPFRMLNPSTGRWLSRDPLGMVDGTNMYAYVAGNPINFVDPDGLFFDVAIDIAFIGYDIYKVITDKCNRGDHLKALGLDVAGAVIPGAVGLGAAYKASKTVKRFSKEKEVLVAMAKADKKNGITRADMDAYRELNRQLPDPFPGNMVRLDPGHSGRGPHAQVPHGHVGPVDHIPILDP